MGILTRILGKGRSDVADARGLYKSLMSQSRKPEFYGAGKVPDTYDGRVDFLTFHLAFVMKVLRASGPNGVRLSQSLYDVMVDDFDLALREEGLTDTGVKRRIKPIVKLFFSRLKAYSECEGVEGLQDALKAHSLSDADVHFLANLSTYGRRFEENLESKSFGELAKAEFSYPELGK